MRHNMTVFEAEASELVRTYMKDGMTLNACVEALDRLAETL